MSNSHKRFMEDCLQYLIIIFGTKTHNYKWLNFPNNLPVAINVANWSPSAITSTLFREALFQTPKKRTISDSSLDQKPRGGVFAVVNVELSWFTITREYVTAVKAEIRFS